MCAVLDASIAGELFTAEREPVPDHFFRWLRRGGRLVVGGRQWRELAGNARAKAWLLSAISRGQVRRLDPAAVEAVTRQIQDCRGLRSDDAHVLAVAVVGDARLLYSNDAALHKDFKDANLVPSPAGHVYTSRPVRQKRGGKSAQRPRSLTSGHRTLLRRNDLCAGCD